MDLELNYFSSVTQFCKSLYVLLIITLNLKPEILKVATNKPWSETDTFIDKCTLTIAVKDIYLLSTTSNNGKSWLRNEAKLFSPM